MSRPSERVNLTHENDDLLGSVYHVTTIPQYKHRRRKHDRVIALSDCVSIMPDGSTRIIRKNSTKVQLTPPNKRVKIRRRSLKAPLTVYVALAEHYGLNPRTVAEQFRYRRDNGYSIEDRIVNIEMNATFRGGDH